MTAKRRLPSLASYRLNRPLTQRAAASRAADRAAAELVRALAAEAERRAAELEEELSLARDLQQGLLLEAAPRIPGWEIAATSLPARDLGGDLYDFLPLSAGQHGVMIGDVSGKGLSAALRMAVARTLFRHAARLDRPAAETLAAVNHEVAREIPQGMVTMLYARLDPQSGELQIANAGHTFPIFIAEELNELELPGMPLGVMSDSEYDGATSQIRPGERALLYTDGVIEAEDARGEIFGSDRLAALLRSGPARPRALLTMLLHELRAWAGGRSQSDDITIVVLRRRFTRLDHELREIARDVLGEERLAGFWQMLPVHLTGPEVTPNDWLEALPDLIRDLQRQFNRGIARELQQELRLTIEDYRLS